MKYFRNVGWEFGQTKADFQVRSYPSAFSF